MSDVQAEPKISTVQDGASDDGIIYAEGGFPSVEGNNPNRVCRDFVVTFPDKRRITARNLPQYAEPFPTTGFIDRALGTPSGPPASRWELPPMKGPKIEFCARPTMLGLAENFDKTSLFFQVVHTCFCEHYPLALSPEVLMYLVLHEVAVTVKEHPNDYRHLFTSAPEGEKKLIHVLHNGLRLGSPNSPWHEVLGLFNVGLADRVPKGLLEHALPTFSTHTVETQAASLVAFMDAASPYYAFRCTTMCGIPKIRLLGTPEDYRKLVVACGALAEVFSKHLGLYFQYLLPVVKTISDQAALPPDAPVDHTFWSSIYKYLSGSGTDAMTGWITAFLNYTCQNDKFVQKETDYFDWSAPQKGWPRGYERDFTPCHLNRVEFVWNYFGVEKKMEFIGGLLGLDDPLGDGYVTPRLSFAVAHKEG